MATTKDFFSTPALSLTLAGIFRSPSSSSCHEEESQGRGKRGRDEEEEDCSDDNSGLLLKSLSDEEELPSSTNMEDEHHSIIKDEKKMKKKKSNKNYHRHTTAQIREMEALFKESPHPDEKQRQQLSNKLGLAPRQVKFWFQNRRTQIKAVQERHENSILKCEIEKLREENKWLRESGGGMSSCSNCGFMVKAELEKKRVGEGEEEEEEEEGEMVNGGEEERIMEMVEEGVEELQIMASEGDPLWVTNLETGREILNYDEYVKRFSASTHCSNPLPLNKQSIEASRDTAFVFADALHLLSCFIDVHLWKEMFPFIISKASVIEIMCHGDENDNKSGITQLMFAELQMLTAVVPVRGVYFVRHCRRIGIERWIVVDVSVDRMERGVDASLANCRRRPSGCIIQDKVNGHCKVTWVEHMESDKSGIPLMYRAIVNSGQAFGASHWMATLKLQCERLAFFKATNVPSKDTIGVKTLAGRRSILRLAQRMTKELCHVVGASNNYTWMKIDEEKSDNLIKVSSRRNFNYSGQPTGLLICVTTSVWLPVSPSSLFTFLKDNTTQWAVESNEGRMGSICRLVKGQDSGNVVTIEGMDEEGGEEGGEEKKWVIKDCYTNGKEWMIAYACVGISKMKGVIEGCDSTDIAILPSGFSIMPDGIEPHPLLITTTTTTTTRRRTGGEETESNNMESCGSLLTIAFQSHLPTTTSLHHNFSDDSFKCVAHLLSITLANIRRGLCCQTQDMM